MDGWKYLCCGSRRLVSNLEPPPEPEHFSLPSPIPRWPQGDGGFARGSICVGELELRAVTKFQRIWSCQLSNDKGRGASFYRPTGVPDGFFCLGHYAQSNAQQRLHGFLLVAREVKVPASRPTTAARPALQRPLDYALVWSSSDGRGHLWLPRPAEGYRSVGFVVTSEPGKPSLEEVRCVRADLTDECEAHTLILDVEAEPREFSLGVWTTRPSDRGMRGKGVPVGAFFCSSYRSCRDAVYCLKNTTSDAVAALHAMPRLEQIHALIKQYGPVVFFHPKEVYLPSSVPWFFKNGAALHRKGGSQGEPIAADGSNLPAGGGNDGEYWIDFPADGDAAERLKYGDLGSAELYAHVKPALGGTFTDVAMWVFCPFNGPGTIKVGVLNFPLSRTGQHVGDWEHFTLRVSNFTGELWGVYYSQHSGGVWVDAPDLEFIEGNRAVVYSSRSGHASFPRPGLYLQGSQKLGVGVRNDAARSKFRVDSSDSYQVVAAEYLGDRAVAEPHWLQYMREWGPTVVYNSRAELERIISYLPVNLRVSVESILNKLPVELFKEEGPTGPKEKNNWEGDERW